MYHAVSVKRVHLTPADSHTMRNRCKETIPLALRCSLLKQLESYWYMAYHSLQYLGHSKATVEGLRWMTPGSCHGAATGSHDGKS